MKVYIIGQRSFGAAVLTAALESGCEVAGVSAPSSDDRLAIDAARNGVPLVTGPLRADAIPAVDVGLSAHCHTFIRAEGRARMRLGCLGYHPSLLPLHRGRDAVRWAVHMREPVTGGTLFWVTDGVDAGPVAAQELVFIPRGADASVLWRDRLFPLGVRLFRGALATLAGGGSLPAVPQDETLATWEPAWGRPPLSGHGRLLA